MGAGISCGIIGLPNVGKSTLFNAITRSGARVANFPFCTIEPNIGTVAVSDERLARLNAVEQRPKAIPAAVEFVDIAGLVEGASRGEGRGNDFLENIHHVDLLVHVVRCFSDPNVAHVRADLDPLDDIRTINLELLLADLSTAGKAIQNLTKKSRSGDPAAREALAALTKLHDHLDAEQPARTAGLSPVEWRAIRDYRFLTRKRVMYVANVDEGCLPGLENEMVAAIRSYAVEEGNTVLPICAGVEAELAELDPEEAAEFMAELGLEVSGLDRVVQECYKQLGLITFFTVGEKEVRAWTTRAGSTAPQAGGVIHTDFETLFIRAETTAFADFEACGSRHEAKEHGRMRVEGKDYVVQDGDILFFRIGR
ncbi:MAG: redox-regulated ATPase YchF [Lentisphaerae bacterium]|jgi:ribosome-binding ATPase|nr:redox-regulated ATPase YchF [Lentisphaerota bacterium]MBT4819045.1 redox-regulated ATPase YchF [Lentisphaerota bacterium]MBT5612309.1 redox-regulated ATPase YchF [Lentisphaerota bacterium]MBT7060713.1 redox-regulated ATPase YchF [Lentisphaerota bacterium]MBT7845288.1 redox-regulated ATPase YchF [Lentisphaerota bacterium]